MRKEEKIMPFIAERADPFVTKSKDGTYYFTASYPMKREDDPNGYDRVVLRRAKSVGGLAAAEEKTIWKSTDDTESHRFIWAPELHYIGSKWYLLYAGSASQDNYWNFDCRMLQCLGDDPYEDIWVEKGRCQPIPEDLFSFTGFSLDMTYFECNSQAYVIWAQHSPQKISCLYMATVRKEEPWKLTSKPTLLSQPEYDWEKVRYAVNEGPSVVMHDGIVYVSFSASGTGPEYCVGLLEADVNANLLDSTCWKKHDKPILSSENLVNEFGPGHNCFVKDENGIDLMIYHSRSLECFEGKCGYSDNDPLFDPCRHARVLEVEWSQGSLSCRYSLGV